MIQMPILTFPIEHARKGQAKTKYKQDGVEILNVMTFKHGKVLKNIFHLEYFPYFLMSQN